MNFPQRISQIIPYSRDILTSLFFLKSDLKSLSTRGPGRRDTCHYTDFFQTFTVYESLTYSKTHSSSGSQLIHGVLEPPHQTPRVKGLLSSKNTLPKNLCHTNRMRGILISLCLMVVWTLRKQFLKVGVIWYNFCQFRAVNHYLRHAIIPKKKNLRFFDCKCLQ